MREKPRTRLGLFSFANVMFLISEPEARLLVSSTETDNHETTLVIPELGRDRVEYFKCLVDSGTAFKEHAVVIWEGQLEGESDALLVIRALNASRPTEVSFLVHGEPRGIEAGETSPAGVAACAVVRRLTDAHQGTSTVLGLRTTKTGRFYTCVKV